MSLPEMSLDELRARRALADLCIRALMQMDDPRQPDALAHYRAQLARIDAEITRKERDDRAARGVPEPEPVVVGLKSALLFGKTGE